MSTIVIAGNDGQLSWSINLTDRLSSFILRYEEMVAIDELGTEFILQVWRYSEYAGLFELSPFDLCMPITVTKAANMSQLPIGISNVR